MNRVVCTVFFTCIACLPALSQVDVAGRLEGHLSDPSGAMISTATITAKDPATGRESRASSRPDGSYSFESLLPGAYTFTCEAPGFSRFVSTGNVIASQQTVTLNISLQVGRTTSTVQVEAQASQVDTATPTIGSTLENREINALPVLGRDPKTALELTQAGAIPEGNFNGTRVRYNGTRGATQGYTIDGTDAVDYIVSGGSNFPQQENIAELSVVTSGASAEYGNSASGQITVITKSGSNQLHGMFWTYLQNSGWNANSWQGNRAGQARPSGSQQWYGGNIGGPVVLPHIYNGREKTFFFGSYEQTSQSGGGLVQARVLSPGERIGDFSGDPISKWPVINGVPTPRISPSQFSSVGNALLSNSTLMPLPNGPNSTYSFNGTSTSDLKRFLIRMDHQFTDKHRVYGTVQWINNPSDISPGAWGKFGLPELPDGGSQGNVNKDQIWNINDTYTFTPSLVNTFVFGASILEGGPVRGKINTNLTWQNLGFPGVVPDFNTPKDEVQLVVNCNWGCSPAAGFTIWGNYNNINNQNLYYFSDNISWIKGRHTMKFGYTQRSLTQPYTQDWEGNGLYYFQPGNPGSTGNAFADLLLGVGAKFSQSSYQALTRNYPASQSFAQDEWKVSERLTLSYGLRFEPYLGIREPQGQLVAFRPGQQSQTFPNAPLGLVVPGDPGITKAITPIRWTDFAPRAGVAYDPTGKGKMSIRGYYEMFYDYQYTGGYNNFANTVPYAFSYNPSASTAPNGVSLTDPYYGHNYFPYTKPAPGSQATKAYVFPDLTQGVTMLSLDPNFNAGRIHNWNASFQWEAFQGYTFSASYIGTRGTHLLESYDMNSALFVPNGSTNTNQQQRRPYSQFSAIDTTAAVGMSRYNALQIQMSKRYAHGFSILANYTYSRSKDDGDAVGQYFNGGSQRDPRNREADYGLSTFDTPHVFNITYTWDLPFWKSAPWLAKAAFGGWRFSGFASAQAGTALQLSSPAGFDAQSANFAWPNYVGGALYGPRTSRASQANEWINPASFCPANAFGAGCVADPKAGVNYLAIGNAQRGIVRGPGGFYNNMTLTKSVPLSERWGKIEYSVSAFNVFNHTVLQNPDTNVANSTFGQITTAAPPRNLQMSLHYTF